MSRLAVATRAYTTSPARRLGRLRLVAPSNDSCGSSAGNGPLMSTTKFWVRGGGWGYGGQGVEKGGAGDEVVRCKGHLMGMRVGPSYSVMQARDPGTCLSVPLQDVAHDGLSFGGDVPASVARVHGTMWRVHARRACDLYWATLHGQGNMLLPMRQGSGVPCSPHACAPLLFALQPQLPRLGLLLQHPRLRALYLPLLRRQAGPQPQLPGGRDV
jgi:hypothetical protein